MRIIIENLGAVKSADIDLSKDITLFCGPNGTGKTYVAYILNYLFNSWGRNFVTVTPDYSDEFRNSGKISITEQDLQNWVSSLESAIVKELPSIFGITRSESNNLFHNAKIRLITGTDDLERIKKDHLNYKIYLGLKKVSSFEKKENEMEFHFQMQRDGATEQAASDANYLSHMIGAIFKRALLSRFSSRMLTVERNSIYTFKTELTNNRFEAVDQVLISENGDAESIVRSRTSLYPLAVRDSLSVANDLENIIKRKSSYTDFANEIERDLLSGTVSVGKEGDVQFLPGSKKEGTDAVLPIRMTSSAVKTLSGLVIYLKHLAHKGDVLIVDEPEMNLHPDNQRRLARIFARMVNKGIRLVISTHSDYIIREFNNLIMAGALPLVEKGVIESVGYTDDELLDKSRMQSFLFNFDNQGNVTAEPIDIDDYGLEVLTIDDTIEAQNEVTLTLRDTLEEL